MSDLLTQTLAEKYPTAGRALAEAAGLAASLELPRPTVHVISDIHGEHKKLRHVINNASGSLRPLVARLFDDELTPQEQTDLLKIIYYPRDFLDKHCSDLPEHSDARHEWVHTHLTRLLRLVRHLAGAHRGRVWERLTERPFRELFREYFNVATYRRPPAYSETLLRELARHDQDFVAVRHACRLVRNLSVQEIVVAGDLGDRGPRIDKVIDLLTQQPNVAITWGNHDISWIGACVGQDALLAIVLRISLRYLRIWQLEEGYGIALAPLEMLARTQYPEDPPAAFHSKRGATHRADELVARMHLAIAVIQFKLEAQTIRRNPEWEMDDRILLDRIDYENHTLDGHPLEDFPAHAFDPKNPEKLLPAEQECLDRLHSSFISSTALWDHMLWVVENGSMSLTRDHVAILHACIPVDEEGNFLSSPVPGPEKTASGQAALSAYEAAIRATYNSGGHTTKDASKDYLYYLWAGPRSPLFGKDKMATFESYFITDKAASKETKNPYFSLINDPEFTRRVCTEVGIPDGPASDCLLVNGHIPVKPEHGESPLKKGGNAVTIDGAFSEAYGDRGYTLILSPDGASLAEHYHFDSVAEALDDGADIVPEITTLQTYNPPRRWTDTPEAASTKLRISALHDLVEAYRNGEIQEKKSWDGEPKLGNA